MSAKTINEVLVSDHPYRDQQEPRGIVSAETFKRTIKRHGLAYNADADDLKVAQSHMRQTRSLAILVGLMRVAVHENGRVTNFNYIKLAVNMAEELEAELLERDKLDT